jgi:hypothetical protein
MAGYLQRRAWDEGEPSFILWALWSDSTVVFEYVTPFAGRSVPESLNDDTYKVTTSAADRVAPNGG